MAKSPTECIRELTHQLGRLTARNDERDRIVERLPARFEKYESHQASDHQRHESVLLARIDHLESRLRNAEVEGASQKQLLQDHLTHYQERDRRLWGLVLVLIGAVLSLASGLIVTLGRK